MSKEKSYYEKKEDDLLREAVRGKKIRWPKENCKRSVDKVHDFRLSSSGNLNLPIFYEKDSKTYFAKYCCSKCKKKKIVCYSSKGEIKSKLNYENKK